MNKRENLSPLMGDIEMPHPTVADSIGGELGAEPLTVRLGDLWADFMRVADQARDPETPKGSTSAVPLLDDMKGILQWD
jgi:hypothetical protein